jgi:hypothetical protein
MAREPEEWGGEARLPTWVREIARTARFTRQQPGARARGAHGSGFKVNPDGAAPVEVLGSGALADLRRERRTNDREVSL